MLAASLVVAGCGGADRASCLGHDEQGNVTLCPPERGFQIETEAFEVPVGQEVQDCYFFDVPSGAPAYVRRIEVAQNDGTHHMNLFRVNTVVGLDGAPGEVVHGGECWTSGNWADWPLIINSQESRPGAVNPDDPTAAGHYDWELPRGVAWRFEPGEKIMLQTHYVNVGAAQQTTPGGMGKVVVSFHTAEPSAVEAELGTAFATNQSICVCPEDDAAHPATFEATCQLAREGEAGVTIIAANGHFHSRGDRFTMATVDAGGEVSAPFYENTVWDDPVMARNLAVSVPPGGGVHYAGTFHLEDGECGTSARHPSGQCLSEDPCCMTFGGHVENQEHCNAFVYYYPKLRDVGCF